jgi:hypothetical protein
MKKTIAILAVLLAAQTYAETAWVNVGLREINKFQHPQTVTVEGRTVSLPPTLTDSTLAYLAAAGWVAYEYDCAAADTILDYDAVPPFRCLTAQELADREAARAAEQAAAEAAASLPLQSATGFAVQDSDGHWIELEPTGDGLPVIGVRVSNSPLTPEERAAMKAERKAAHDALKAAAQGKKLNDKAKVALLMKAVFGMEE